MKKNNEELNKINKAIKEEADTSQIQHLEDDELEDVSGAALRPPHRCLLCGRTSGHKPDCPLNFA